MLNDRRCTKYVAQTTLVQASHLQQTWKRCQRTKHNAASVQRMRWHLKKPFLEMIAKVLNFLLFWVWVQWKGSIQKAQRSAILERLAHLRPHQFSYSSLKTSLCTCEGWKKRVGRAPINNCVALHILCTFYKVQYIMRRR